MESARPIAVCSSEEREAILGAVPFKQWLMTSLWVAAVWRSGKSTEQAPTESHTRSFPFCQVRTQTSLKGERQKVATTDKLCRAHAQANTPLATETRVSDAVSMLPVLDMAACPQAVWQHKHGKGQYRRMALGAARAFAFKVSNRIRKSRILNSKFESATMIVPLSPGTYH